MEIKSQIPLFLETIHAERNAAINTLNAYRRDLEGFATHLDTTNTPIETCTRQDLEAYFKRLTDQGYSNSTISRHLSAVKQFFGFLYEDG